MNTEKLYEFLILSKTLNYSKAANVLYISQSVLSKHINDMEKELNTRLFDRTTHGVSLTLGGQLLAKEAEPLLEKCNSAINSVQLHELPTTGNVKVGCVQEFSFASHIQIFVSRFMERYPDININFEVLSHGAPESFLTQYDFIFSPCEYVNTPPNTISRFVNSHRTYAALPPGHRLLSKTSVQLRELSGETIIVPYVDDHFGPYAKNWSLVKKYTLNHVNSIFAANLSSALFLVSIGKGIAIVPRYTKKMLPNNTFMINISAPFCCYNEYIYYQENKKNGAAKLFFEEFCSTCLPAKN